MVKPSRFNSKSLFDKIYEKYFITPLPLFITIIVSIFIAETAVMLIISRLNHLSIISEAFIDSFFLVLIVFPVLYYLIVKPLQFQISKKTEVENKLREYYKSLEGLVEERTSEYVNANEKLKIAINERKRIEEELRRRVKELEEFYSMSVGREVKMQELKNEIEKLKLHIKQLETEL